MVDPELEYLKKDRAEKIREFMSNMPLREKYIIECRHGFRGITMTFREIGEHLGVSGGRARQIYNTGMARLRHPSFIRQIYWRRND